MVEEQEEIPIKKPRISKMNKTQLQDELREKKALAEQLEQRNTMLHQQNQKLFATVRNLMNTLDELRDEKAEIREELFQTQNQLAVLRTMHNDVPIGLEMAIFENIAAFLNEDEVTNV